MSTTHIFTRKTGFIIYGWLVVLTLAEVGLVAYGVPKTVGVILMIGTTFAKVMMIALYFMHMIHDSFKAWLLPAIPVVLAIFFVLMLFPDIVYQLPLRFR